MSTEKVLNKKKILIVVSVNKFAPESTVQAKNILKNHITRLRVLAILPSFLSLIQVRVHSMYFKEQL